VYDPVSHLLHAADRSDVTHAWIGGTPVLAERRLLTLDAAAVVATARAWQARLH
jgi:5-methylthioadenosine/S-adenosylhomocysteine deaminase